MTLGIFYASTSGRTKKVAELIAAEWTSEKVDLCPITNHQPADLLAYDRLILGSPTYGQGDLHHNWLAWRPEVEQMDLSDKWVALFALGDQRYHGKSFAGAIGHLRDMVVRAGALPVGAWPATGYKFQASAAVSAVSMFPGLVVDEVNQRRDTARRVQEWVNLLRVSDDPTAGYYG